MEAQQQGQNRAMRPMTNVLPSSVNRIKEATKIYTESIKKIKGMKNPMHLTLQEGNRGGPSTADITSILGSDRQFFTIEYIKQGKRHVTAILPGDKRIYEETE